MQFLYHIHSIISLCFFNNINIGGKYFDFPWYLKKDHTIINTSVYTETVNCWRYNWEISNNNNDPDAKFCVPDFVKNINIKVFNLIPRTNEARHIEWHETCKCKFRLDVSVFNNKHRWKNNKSICECKELIDKGICNKGFVWNLSNYECQCDKSCHINMNFYENIWNIKIVGVEKI